MDACWPWMREVIAGFILCGEVVTSLLAHLHPLYHHQRCNPPRVRHVDLYFLTDSTESRPRPDTEFLRLSAEAICGQLARSNRLPVGSTGFHEPYKANEWHIHWQGLPVIRLFDDSVPRPTLGHLLHRFSVAADQVGYDGTDVHFTAGARFAYEYRLNVHRSADCSPTYMRRLHQLFHHGFSILLSDLEPRELESIAASDSDLPIEYEGMKLLHLRVWKGYIYGDTEVPRPPMLESLHRSFLARVSPDEQFAAPKLLVPPSVDAASSCSAQQSADTAERARLHHLSYLAHEICIAGENRKRWVSHLLDYVGERSADQPHDWRLPPELTALSQAVLESKKELIKFGHKSPKTKQLWSLSEQWMNATTEERLALLPLSLQSARVITAEFDRGAELKDLEDRRQLAALVATDCGCPVEATIYTSASAIAGEPVETTWRLSLGIPRVTIHAKACRHHQASRKALHALFAEHAAIGGGHSEDILDAQPEEPISEHNLRDFRMRLQMAIRPESDDGRSADHYNAEYLLCRLEGIEQAVRALRAHKSKRTIEHSQSL